MLIDPTGEVPPEIVFQCQDHERVTVWPKHLLCVEPVRRLLECPAPLVVMIGEELGHSAGAVIWNEIGPVRSVEFCSDRRMLPPWRLANVAEF